MRGYTVNARLGLLEDKVDRRIAKAEDDLKINMWISKKNREDNAETYIRLSNELGSHFVFFGKILIYYIFDSWIEQKKAENLD